MSIISTNSVTLQDSKEDLLLEVYNKNKLFSTVHKDRLGKDIHEGDMVFCISPCYSSFDVTVGQIVGFTDLRVKVQSYERAPTPYLSVDNYPPDRIIRMEMDSIRDMFGIKK